MKRAALFALALVWFCVVSGGVCVAVFYAGLGAAKIPTVMTVFVFPALVASLATGLLLAAYPIARLLELWSRE